MSEAIVVALITGGLSLAGVYLANRKGQNLMEYKLEELTQEVRKHNNFAERIPVIEEKIKVANNRIGDLEKKMDAR